MRTTLNQGASILLDKLIGVQKKYGKCSQPSLVVNSTVIAEDLQLINMGRFIFPAIHFGNIALTTLSRLKTIISAACNQQNPPVRQIRIAMAIYQLQQLVYQQSAGIFPLQFENTLLYIQQPC
jgi:hypothetical protein